jgi:hypothetical protein
MAGAAAGRIYLHGGPYYAREFLAKHLGGRYQGIGDDFAGCSLKVETGGELVPGLSG